MTMRSSLVACGSILALAATACAPWTPKEAMKQVTGTITPSHAGPFVAGSVAHAKLAKLDENGDAVVVIEEKIFPADGVVSVPFALNYDPRRVDPDDTFGVKVRILAGERLLYTAAPALVLTHGNGDVVALTAEPTWKAAPAPAAAAARAAPPRATPPAPSPPEPARQPETRDDDDRDEAASTASADTAPTGAAPQDTGEQDATGQDATEPDATEKPERIGFAIGSSSAAASGRVEGSRVRTYEIEGKARQTLGVRLESRSSFAHFRVRSGDAVLFDSSLSPTRGWQGALPRGDVEIEVFLAEEEAQRLGSAEYSLQIEIH